MEPSKLDQSLSENISPCLLHHYKNTPVEGPAIADQLEPSGIQNIEGPGACFNIRYESVVVARCIVLILVEERSALTHI